ncbi:Ldh family oxidoreductase [Candidatus Woesearchaeota archaeon]|nr:Ldh family oxidoreductase [Candidatus Woesearchaeota archaeon]
MDTQMYRAADVGSYVRKLIVARYNAGDEDALLMANSYVSADLRGVHTHGINLLSTVIDSRFNAGKINPKAEPQDITGRTSYNSFFALFDGNAGFGHRAAQTATERTIKSAKEHGFGLTVVRNTNHYGSAEYYTLQMAEKGLIGFSSCTTVQWGRANEYSNKWLGTDPIAVAFPTSVRIFSFDGATTLIAANNILRAYVQGDMQFPIPVFFNGQWSKDVYKFKDITELRSDGSIPMLGGPGGAEYKGGALCMALELLMHADGTFETRNNFEPPTRHIFAALRPDLQVDADTALRNFANVVKDFRASGESVHVPGDERRKRFEHSNTNGIAYGTGDIEKLHALGRQHNLEDLIPIG